MKDKEKMAGKCSTTSNESDTMHPAEADMVLGIDNTNEFGRFKDAKGLLDAYNSLQSEFTRRCQRVKELERELGKLNSLEKPEMNSNNFSSREEREGFILKFPETQAQIESLYEIAEKNGDKSHGRLERAYILKLQSEILNQKNYYTSHEYLNSALSQSDDFKDEVIRGYLDKIYGSNPKIPLISGDGKAYMSPPSNPKNLTEAGNLAKQIFDKYKENL